MPCVASAESGVPGYIVTSAATNWSSRSSRWVFTHSATKRRTTSLFSSMPMSPQGGSSTPPGVFLPLPGFRAALREREENPRSGLLEGMLRAGERAAADVVGVLPGRAQQLGAQVGVLLHELRHPA